MDSQAQAEAKAEAILRSLREAVSLGRTHQKLASRQRDSPGSLEPELRADARSRHGKMGKMGRTLTTHLGFVCITYGTHQRSMQMGCADRIHVARLRFRH